MRLLPCGERALLAEVDDLDAVLRLHATLAAAPPPGVVELVPAARTVLVAFDPAQTDSTSVARALRALAPGSPTDSSPAAGPGATVEIPVIYDGEDLPDVAEAAGLSPDEVAELHAAGAYTVAFCGFAPGFGYLTGLDERLHVPRLDSPRTRVPAGAVAVAGEFTAVYPRASPGGWRLIGRTDAVLWDVDRDPPALLAPGTQVRFVAA